jgi:hypothetical protein
MACWIHALMRPDKELVKVVACLYIFCTSLLFHFVLFLCYLLYVTVSNVALSFRKESADNWTLNLIILKPMRTLMKKVGNIRKEQLNWRGAKRKEEHIIVQTASIDNSSKSATKWNWSWRNMASGKEMFRSVCMPIVKIHRNGEKNDDLDKGYLTKVNLREVKSGRSSLHRWKSWC